MSCGLLNYSAAQTLLHRTVLIGVGYIKPAW